MRLAEKIRDASAVYGNQHHGTRAADRSPDNSVISALCPGHYWFGAHDSFLTVQRLFAPGALRSNALVVTYSKDFFFGTEANEGNKEYEYENLQAIALLLELSPLMRVINRRLGLPRLV
jgi:hypothetical protein